MQKLCCFPLSDPPNINVTMKCTSACCASKMTSSKSHIPSLSKSVSADSDTQNTSCCCKTKRVLSPSTPSLSKISVSVDSDTQNTSCCCKTKPVLSRSTQGRTEKEEATDQ